VEKEEVNFSPLARIPAGAHAGTRRININSRHKHTKNTMNEAYSCITTNSNKF